MLWLALALFFFIYVQGSLYVNPFNNWTYGADESYYDTVVVPWARIVAGSRIIGPDDSD